MTLEKVEDPSSPRRPAPLTLPPAVDLRGVHKSFGSVQAVRGVALAVGSGEVMAFLGPNGAGKTSTIDMILGLSRPDAGEVEVYGMAPRQAVRKGLVSAVMQTGGLLKDLTVAETVQYTARLFAVSRPVGEVLERAGITAIADRMVGKCSGGEQQRLRFAMALIPDPELLILDEPTQGMDVEGRRGFWKAIRDDAALGRTDRLRHPLPGGGGRLRRPDRPDQPRARSWRTGPPPRSRAWPRAGPSGRPCPARTRRHCGPSRAWTASKYAGTPCSSIAATPTPSPGGC